MMSNSISMAELKTSLLEASDYRRKTRAHDLIAALIADQGNDALPILRRAAKGSKKRELVLASIFLERGDAGCEVSDSAIRAIIFEKSHIARDPVLSSMQYSQQSRFAPELREVAKDVTDIGWCFAVAALGDWRDLESASVLMPQTKGIKTPFILLHALVKICVPEAIEVFRANLEHSAPRTRTFALWGLAKLGSEQAIAALVVLLDDPDVSTRDGFTPGQSMRAAQALADVYRVDFNWGDEKEIEKIRNHVQKKSAQPNVK
jgi:HEAT repeat protein